MRGAGPGHWKAAGSSHRASLSRRNSHNPFFHQSHRSVRHHTRVDFLTHTAQRGLAPLGPDLVMRPLRGPCCVSRVLNRKSELNKTVNWRQFIVFLCLYIFNCAAFHVRSVGRLQPYSCPHDLHLSASDFPSLCTPPTWDLGAMGDSLHILEREKQLKGLCSWSLFRSSVSVSPSFSCCSLCFHSRKINVFTGPLARNFIV